MRMTPIVLLCALLVGCAGAPGPKQTGGTLLGAAGGGLAGAQIGSGTGRLAATAAGALLGALIGSEAGVSLDRADQLYYERQALNAAKLRRQVPAPAYVYGAPAVQGSRSYRATPIPAAPPRFNANCRRADEGFNPIHICQDSFGRSFVMQGPLE